MQGRKNLFKGFSSPASERLSVAEHFDLEILDLRYYKLQVIDFVAESDADKLLVLVNADSLVTSNSLAMLNLGLGGN